MREKLADLCHKQWAGWMEYLFSKCFAEVGQFDKDTGNLVIPKWAVDRWRRQMNTPYTELPENEKESDRKEADKFLAMLSPKSYYELIMAVENKYPGENRHQTALRLIKEAQCSYNQSNQADCKLGG